MPLWGCWEVACVPESKGYWRPVAWGPLELKSQVIVSHSMGTGHWPQVLWRNSKGSYLWALSLTPFLMFWVASVLLYFQSSCTFIIGFLRNASPIFTGQGMTAVFFPMTASVSSHFFLNDISTFNFYDISARQILGTAYTRVRVTINTQHSREPTPPFGTENSERILLSKRRCYACP